MSDPGCRVEDRIPTCRRALEPGPAAVRLFSPVTLPGLQVIEADNSTQLWKHFHEQYAVCTSLCGYHTAESHWRGYGTVQYRRRRHQVMPNSVFLTEPGEAHATVFATGPASFRVLLVDPLWMQRNWQERGGRGVPHFGTVVATSPQPFRFFRNLHNCFNGPSSLLDQESRLLEGFACLFDGFAESQPRSVCSNTQPVVDLVRQCVEDRFAEDVSLDDLERATRLSRFYLEHAFRRTMGMPIHEYQVAVRVSRASEQIRRGVPLKEVDVGFYDQAHLTRHFKRIVGVTPGQFRLAVLGQTSSHSSGPASTARTYKTSTLAG
jgi:AraC-like DNA-binding protein